MGWSIVSILSAPLLGMGGQWPTFGDGDGDDLKSGGNKGLT